MPPSFALGFRAFALSHPGVGDPISGEYDASPFTGQMTTTGLLVYEPVARAIGFLEDGEDTQVNADGVRLRDGPGLGYPILTELAAGTDVHVMFAATVQGDGFDWSYCQTPSGEGWIAAQYLGQAATEELTSEPNHLFTLADLWPSVDAAGQRYGIDGRIVAAVAYQESTFCNWLVHADGTGHGLFGLDDGGLLSAFEQRSGIVVGRGQNAISIPPSAQIDYAAYQLHRYAVTYGDPYAACQAWHRGPTLWNDPAGRNYNALIRAHVRALFG